MEQKAWNFSSPEEFSTLLCFFLNDASFFSNLSFSVFFLRHRFRWSLRPKELQCDALCLEMVGTIVYLGPFRNAFRGPRLEPANWRVFPQILDLLPIFGVFLGPVNKKMPWFFAHKSILHLFWASFSMNSKFVWISLKLWRPIWRVWW